nr:proton-conducting transporter membrane subunit [Desulfobacterales bacterium]
HAFGKITLFFCAGAIYVATGKKNISEMTGLGHRMPITMGAFFIGALSVIGLPPTGGFLSKWYLAFGSLDAGQWPVVIVLLTSSLLNAFYFLPIVFKAFFNPAAPESEAQQGVAEAPAWCVVPPVMTAAGSIALFFYPDVFLNLARLALG